MQDHSPNTASFLLTPQQWEPPRVSWSPEAIRDLELTVKDRSVQEDLKRNAEEILHEIQERSDEYREDHSDEYREDHSDEYREDHSADEGRAGEVMWHRGWTHEQERQAEWDPEDPAEDGPWNYFLFYRKAPGPAVFEVLAVRSCIQIANRWNQLNGNEDVAGGPCLAGCLGGRLRLSRGYVTAGLEAAGIPAGQSARYRISPEAAPAMCFRAFGPAGCVQRCLTPVRRDI